MYKVYVIRSELTRRFYVGMTVNVEKRIEQHNKGMTSSTKGYRPWKLFFYEVFETRAEARKREIYLKSGIGKEYIKNKWSGSSVEYLPAGRQGAAAF
jgi:putative endonuclease